MLGVQGTVGYEERGGGAPVVLLHPFPFTRNVWGGLADTLAARHRVLAVDARGFGESPLRGGYTLADLADDVAALLDERGVDRATLLGMSMGGYTALAFAARHRERLEALILADTRAAADSPEARAGRGKAIETIQRDGAEAYLNGSLARLFSANAPPAILAQARARAEKRPASLIAGIEALRDRPDRSGELDAIRCPTLVVCGDGDQVTPPAEMQLLAKAIPNATFQLITGTGHIAHLEAPDAFERVVADFLETAGPGATP
jgi:pimeloyl-ACP methyl ester carboxylesterase